MHWARLNARLAVTSQIWGLLQPCLSVAAQHVLPLINQPQRLGSTPPYRPCCLIWFWLLVILMCSCCAGALVPFADLFNHAPGLGPEPPHIGKPRSPAELAKAAAISPLCSLLTSALSRKQCCSEQPCKPDGAAACMPAHMLAMRALSAGMPLC